MMTPYKRAHIVNKISAKIEANPANFSADFLDELGIQKPEFLKPRPFLVLNPLNEVICELVTTPVGARETQVLTGCSVVPKPEKKEEEEDNE